MRCVLRRVPHAQDNRTNKVFSEKGAAKLHDEAKFKGGRSGPYSEAFLVARAHARARVCTIVRHHMHAALARAGHMCIHVRCTPCVARTPHAPRGVMRTEGGVTRIRVSDPPISVSPRVGCSLLRAHARWSRLCRR